LVRVPGAFVQLSNSIAENVVIHQVSEFGGKAEKRRAYSVALEAR